MPMTTPCKDCRERAPKCHATCPKYKAFRDSLEQIRKERKKGYAADALRAESVVKIKKRIGKEHTK